jgi:hypothetical protein
MVLDCCFFVAAINAFRERNSTHGWPDELTPWPRSWRREMTGGCLLFELEVKSLSHFTFSSPWVVHHLSLFSWFTLFILLTSIGCQSSLCIRASSWINLFISLFLCVQKQMREIAIYRQQQGRIQIRNL